MRPFFRAVFVIFASVAVVLFLSRIQPAWPSVRFASSTGADDDQGCSNDAGLMLPGGFCGTVFADGIGHARDMVVAPNGLVYVNTWSSHYYGNKPPHDGGFLVALQDTTNLGKANVVERFGETPQSGGTGGNGIALYKNAIYAEINDRIVRYSLTSGFIVPNDPGVTVVSGLPLTGDHPMHPFVIDSKGEIFVDVASPSNACQEKNRVAGSPGKNPCLELEARPTTSCMTIGRTSIGLTSKPRYRLNNSCSSKRAPITAGLNATTIHLLKSWFWRPSTAVMAKK